MSALGLRILACLLMIADHVGYSFHYISPWMKVLRLFGRLSFPLYVFLLVNGFRHSHNRPRYALRLGFFALISQWPFMLMFHPDGDGFKLNVFFSLLVCLLAVWAMDELLKKGVWKPLALVPPLIVFALAHFELLPVEYGARGILMAVIFYFFEKKPLLQCAGLLPATQYSWLLRSAARLVTGGEPIALSSWGLMQTFGALAFLPIMLYNGTAGKLPETPWAKKAVQLGFYLFYPLHLLLLCAIR